MEHSTSWGRLRNHWFRAALPVSARGQEVLHKRPATAQGHSKLRMSPKRRAGCCQLLHIRSLVPSIEVCRFGMERYRSILPTHVIRERQNDVWFLRLCGRNADRRLMHYQSPRSAIMELCRTPRLRPIGFRLIHASSVEQKKSNRSVKADIFLCCLHIACLSYWLRHPQ